MAAAAGTLTSGEHERAAGFVKAPTQIVEQRAHLVKAAAAVRDVRKELHDVLGRVDSLRHEEVPDDAVDEARRGREAVEDLRIFAERDPARRRRFRRLQPLHRGHPLRLASAKLALPDVHPLIRSVVHHFLTLITPPNSTPNGWRPLKRNDEFLFNTHRKHPSCARQKEVGVSGQGRRKGGALSAAQAGVQQPRSVEGGHRDHICVASALSAPAPPQRDATTAQRDATTRTFR